jgi:hypothetical protein
MSYETIQTEAQNHLDLANQQSARYFNSSYNAFKNSQKLFAENRVPSELNIIYVKNGVANVTDYFEDSSYKGSYYHGGRRYRSYMLQRTPTTAPDGHYLIGHDGNLIPTNNKIKGPFGGYVEYPFALDLIRPPFEKPDEVVQCCVITKGIVAQMLRVAQTALDKEVSLTMNHLELTLKTGTSCEPVLFDFNVRGVLFFDPLHLQVALANALARFQETPCYLMQTLWGDNPEQYQGPIILGSSWDDCCLIKPIYDEYYKVYH